MQAGRLTYTEAVRDGMYRPLGQGDVDVAAIVTACAAATTTAGTRSSRTRSSPRSPRGEGPVADVHTSVEYLRGLLTA